MTGVGPDHLSGKGPLKRGRRGRPHLPPNTGGSEGKRSGSVGTRTNRRVVPKVWEEAPPGVGRKGQVYPRLVLPPTLTPGEWYLCTEDPLGTEESPGGKGRSTPVPVGRRPMGDDTGKTRGPPGRKENPTPAAGMYEQNTHGPLRLGGPGGSTAPGRKERPWVSPTGNPSLDKTFWGTDGKRRQSRSKVLERVTDSNI